MSHVVQYKSPKERCVEDERFVSRHRDLMAMEELTESIEAALHEYQRLLSTTPLDNWNNAAAAHLKIVGAQEFVKVLFELCETPTPRAPAPNRNLDHRV